MRTLVHERIAGSTLRVTWVNTGVTPTLLTAALRDRNDAVVSSLTAISSGNGAYYAVLPLPNTPGWWVNEWIAVINANTYVDRQWIKTYVGDVD